MTIVVFPNAQIIANYLKNDSCCIFSQQFREGYYADFPEKLGKVLANTQIEKRIKDYPLELRNKVYIALSAKKKIAPDFELKNPLLEFIMDSLERLVKHNGVLLMRSEYYTHRSKLIETKI